jgi:hypothetical protein
MTDNIITPDGDDEEGNDAPGFTAATPPEIVAPEIAAPEIAPPEIAPPEIAAEIAPPEIALEIAPDPIIGLDEAEMAERERLAQVRLVQARTTQSRLEQIEVNSKAKAALAAAGFASMPAAKSALDLAIPSKPWRFLGAPGQVFTAFKDRSRLPLPLAKSATR